jgi:hypothetical protein
MSQQTRKERAREYILAHKDESIHQQAMGADVSEPLISLARRELVAEGLLEAGRSTQKTKPAKKADPEPAPTIPIKPNAMLDHTAMAAIADMASLTDDKATDEQVSSAMLKQCIRFAFDPNLHPDTRMSASQMWAKLKERQREKQLGPRAPLTFEAATRRLADLMIAAGAKLTTAALHLAFEVHDEGQLPPEHGDSAPGSAGASPAP